jgi:hypothetical protein
VEHKDTFTIQEIRNYILSQDSLGDVVYNLSADNINKANKQKEKESQGRGCCEECGEGFDNDEDWKYNTECGACGHPIPEDKIIREEDDEEK